MWSTTGGVTLLVCFFFGFFLFRGPTLVGSIWFWTILLIVPVSAAPLI